MTNIFDTHLPPLPPQSDEPSVSPRSNKRRIDGISTVAGRRGAIKLEDLSSLAFDTLEDAMKFAEYPVAVQAAKLVLDRSGFGPSSTLKVEDITDLYNLSTEDLAALAIKIASSVSKDNKSSSNGSESTSVH